MIDLSELRHSFRERFGGSPRVFSAPGRVNLIGEHTDYNDGFVLPIAINRRTYVACAPRRDRRIRVHSKNLDATAEFELDGNTLQPQRKWFSYILGVARTLERHYLSLSGADFLIESEVPMGGGLSSSAALEVATGQALVELCGQVIDPTALALAAQQAEHEFVGAQVGIMDQLTAATAEPDHALLIDCRSLEAKKIPLRNIEAGFVVCNTNVKHQLASSAYNERRQQCEAAVAILKQHLPSIGALRDVTAEDFERFGRDLPEPLQRRARHVVTENSRTIAAADALARGDLTALGKLMRASHESLRDDYEVSSAELDIMVHLASQRDEVFGARMTGGGFGGCTINLVRRDSTEDFSHFIHEKYQEATGLAAEIYVVAADGGVREEPGD